MRVCFVVNAVGETSVPADIATALVEYTDVEVDVLAWFRAEPFEGDDLVDTACLEAPDSTTGIDRATYRRAVDHLREYDLIQAHHNHSGSFAKVIARRLGIPAVSREGNMRSGFNRLGRVANGLTNPLADRVVCNSRAVYDSFRRWEDLLLPDEKVVFIPNGVDFERIRAGRNLEWSALETAGASDDAIIVGTAGMLVEQKNHETLLRALAEARERTDRDVEVLIAGDGPLEERLRELASDLSVAESVHFFGLLERQRVYRFLHEIDVYAMPSRWEGFSAAAVEALAAGNAAVFSEIPPFAGPYSDVARFHPTEDHGALADQLVELSENAEQRDRLAAAGRELVRERYTIESVARQYRDLYRDVLADGGGHM